jgi:Ser/Thr protein kinase RdoA (MazF antagonist)
MADDHDLMTEAGVLAYLKAGGWDHVTSCKALTGGTVNYVYRVAHEEGTFIVKHAEPHIRADKDLSFDTARIDFEAKILLAVRKTEEKAEQMTEQNAEDPPVSRARAVRVMSYNAGRKLLFLMDGGERNLKEAYTDLTLDMREIAFDLGKWLATLHNASRNDPKMATQNAIRSVGDNENAAKMYRHSYVNLHLALSNYGHDVNLAERVNNEFGSLLTTDEECLCHGDFWPGNVLLRAAQTTATQYQYSNTFVNPTGLTIVDWEMSRQGSSATDVGQFAAEAFLLDRFRGDRGLRVDFLDAYILARRWDKNSSIKGPWIIRMAIHWAVHVAFWPTRVTWANEAGTQELVDIGVGVMRLALDCDWIGLAQSPLFDGVQCPEWGEALVMAMD